MYQTEENTIEETEVATEVAETEVAEAEAEAGVLLKDATRSQLFQQLYNLGKLNLDYKGGMLILFGEQNDEVDFSLLAAGQVGQAMGVITGELESLSRKAKDEKQTYDLFNSIGNLCQYSEDKKTAKQSKEFFKNLKHRDNEELHFARGRHSKVFSKKK